MMNPMANPMTAQTAQQNTNLLQSAPGATPSNPSAPLPDVFVSDTSFFLDEGQSRQYTIALSTAPGMREDTTVRRAALRPAPAFAPPDHFSSSRARRSIWTTTRSGST